MNQTQLAFSIIIPTRGRPAQLTVCLDALARLHYPRDRFEVIVVDDGSDQPPEPVVAAFRERLDVTLLRQPHAGPASARNRGAAQARGQFLALTDDDCAPAADWLEKLAARFAASPGSMIGGRTLNALTGNPYAAASQLLVDYIYSYYNADPNRARFFTSNNMALPIERFRQIGGFDQTLPAGAGEDRELCDRWLYHGYAMQYAPEVIVHHRHVMGLNGFCRQHFHYGRAACYFHEVRARRGGGPLRVEPPSFYVNLLRHPFRHGAPPRRLTLASLMALSQAANAAGFFWERGTRGYEKK
jgi:glycosyltransferase involved in cell wall biosynthesis